MPYCRIALMEQNIELLRNSVDYAYVCSGDPQTYAEAVAQKLAEKAINYWSFTGPFAGSIDGRKIVLSSFTSSVATGGDGQSLALVNTTTAILWLAFPRTFPKTLNAGETIEVPAIDIEEGFFTVI